MKPSLLTRALETLILCKQPAFIEGPPGIGKSQVMQQTAKRLGMDMIDVRAVLLDPVDLRGLPHVNGDGLAHWCIPDFLPKKGKGVLFLDELNRAPALVQNACLQLVLDRQIGEYRLPEEWVVMAAGNTSGVGVQKMDAALRSRFVYLDAEIDLEDWCKWAVQSDIEPVTIAFLRFMPQLLHAFDPKQRSFPSPRTWEFVSRITASDPDPAIAHELYKGTVGHAAIEYSAYCRMFKSLPNIDAILLDPGKADIPKNEPGTLFAVTAALARRCTEKTIGRVMTYLDRLPQEYSVYSIRDAVQRDGSLKSTKEFTKWCTKHAEVLF